ncbi:Tyrosine aminotransferase [Zancudomyces culisetae]|uniref:Tyrosine aminotransferase n=1 Tax=Zancudomyces culisetae TaxID=1213189 RepID=A0A1R1PIN7_ZANCU|nr:Tyrosine aminotransferase [Zancudomyces culisetae]|eukprot:OMH80712.1 Tyrosine aminotransferase [Zancudomyces culisetae]
MENQNQWGEIEPSISAMSTFNPIRELLSTSQEKQPGQKSEQTLINLSLGDPTLYGNLKINKQGVDAVDEALKSFECNGYLPGMGKLEARQAIAQSYSNEEHVVDPSNVVLASGCSGALLLCITSLLNPGDNILIPKPGFSLYKTIASSYGIEYKTYNLLPEKQWEINLEELESLVDAKTKAILVNNPSNPCGSNYSKKHLLEIIAFCEKHRLPIIADEIYRDIVFSGEEFYPFYSLTNSVPVLTTGGLAKQFLVPGWRLGWVVVHDPLGNFEKVKRGLMALSNLILGPNSLIQGAIPKILNPTSDNTNFKAHLNLVLEKNAKVCEDALSSVEGLTVVKPQGAMYCMVVINTCNFKDIRNGYDFYHALKWEENVEILPGEVFDFPNSFRIVLAPPEDVMLEAAHRIKRFCERHRV